MPAKKYMVRLDREARQYLNRLVKTGKSAAYKRQRAQVLLKADIGEEGPGLKDHDIAQQLELSQRTVERTRQRLVELGLERALERTPRQKNKARTWDGEKAACLVALSCSEAPQGRQHWPLPFLADRLVELNYVDSVCRETLRKVLKKHHQTLAGQGVVYTAEA